MSTGTNLVRDPARYIEMIIASLALIVGCYFVSVPFNTLNVTEISPSFSEAALSEGAIFGYGLVMILFSLLSLYALIFKTWPFAYRTRRWATLLFFILFSYFTVLRLLTYPERIVWVAVLGVSLICGLLHMRLRLLDR